MGLAAFKQCLEQGFEMRGDNLECCEQAFAPFRIQGVYAFAEFCDGGVEVSAFAQLCFQSLGCFDDLRVGFHIDPAQIIAFALEQGEPGFRAGRIEGGVLWRGFLSLIF